MAFTAEVIDHFEHPRHAGEVTDANVRVRVENPVCGDVLELTARVSGGRCEEVRFRAKGCVAAMAAGSVLAECVLGSDIAGLQAVRPYHISAALGGLPAESQHASHLAVQALQQLIRAV